MRRLTVLLGVLTFTGFMLAACGDSGTGPDPDNDNDGTGGEETTTYTVEVSAAEGGSVSPSGADDYDEGETVELTADSNEEYLFSKWTGDVESDDNPLSLTVDQDYSLTANFEKKTYSLTTNTEGEGAIDENVIQEKSTDYESGTVVELTANPAEGYKFVEWKGDLTGTDNPAQITVDTPKEVTAVFEKKTYSLTTQAEGDGAIDENVIQEKSTDYEHGTVVELTANPGEGYKFVEWKGDLTGTDNPQQITVDSPKEVIAVFEKKSYELTVNTQGEGAVSEEVVQAKAYEHGTTVKLTANSAQGWKFIEWQGDVTGTGNPEQVTVDEAKEVTAVFEKKSFALTTNTSGSGSITKSPDQSAYEYGTTVDLEAAPADGYVFIEWTGAIASTDNPVQITVDEEKEITAVFEEKKAKFYLASNGVTIKCEDASVGETGTVDEVTYTKRSADQITTDNAPTTCTSGVTVMSDLFSSLKIDSFNGDISSWDVSSVTDMSGLFKGAQSFNQDLNSWDVSSVTDMSEMFASANIYNGNISGWDVSRVTDMSYMFNGADTFNGDIGSWDVSSVTNMNRMFYRAELFNQDIGNWDVSSVTNMSSMFEKALAFDRDIGGWDVSGVTDMRHMFYGSNQEVSSFNHDLNEWDVSAVTDMSSMFAHANSFNGDISDWDVSGVTDMSSMFSNADNFNADISSWDVSAVTSMSYMFAEAKAFNQDINYNENTGSWDVSGVEYMNGMFQYASNFNQDLNAWDVSSVGNMSRMFLEATSFNGDISSWNVSNVWSMTSMFEDADAFNQDIGSWDVSSVQDGNMEYMFLRASSFNQNLSSWCVSQIDSKPLDFDADAGFDGNSNYMPKWGETEPCTGS